MTDPAHGSCPVNEQAVGWALRALEPDDEIAVLRHLPHCASCRAAVEDAEQVLARMGAAVEQVDPPPTLRASLLARVAETPQMNRLGPPAAPRPAASPTKPAPQVTPPPTTPPAPPTPPGTTRPATTGPAGSRPPRDGRLSRRTRRLVTAAVALFGVIAISGLAIRAGQLQGERDAVAAQAQAVTQLLDELGDPDSRYALIEQDGATVAAVVVRDGRREVYPIGLPANAVDRDTYVLWGIADGTPQPLGTFDVTAAGDPTGRTVGAGAGGDAFAAYAISIEPGREAPSVPTTVIGAGEVST